jgi:hypothetical protein
MARQPRKRKTAADVVPIRNYTWVNSFGRPPGFPPEVLARWLISFEQEHGRLPTRADLLEEATPETSPFHGYFEWNDRKAAHQYRLGQSSQLLCSLHVEVITPVGQFITMRAFAPVAPPGRDTGFLAIDRIMSDPVLRDQHVRDALGELRSFATKFARLLNHPQVRLNYGMLETAVTTLVRHDRRVG